MCPTFNNISLIYQNVILNVNYDVRLVIISKIPNLKYCPKSMLVISRCEFEVGQPTEKKLDQTV